MFLVRCAEDRQQWGRYSFLGYAPSMEITCTGGVLTVTEGKEEEEKKRKTFHVDHPGEVIRKILEDYRSPAVEGMPPFTGGLVGYFAYDYIRYAEPSLEAPIRASGEGQEFRDVDLMLFDKVIVFDNYRQKLILIAGVSLTGDLEENCRRAERELDEMERLIRSRAKADFRPLVLKEEFRPAKEKEDGDHKGCLKRRRARCEARRGMPECRRGNLYRRKGRDHGERRPDGRTDHR